MGSSFPKHSYTCVQAVDLKTDSNTKAMSIKCLDDVLDLLL